MPDRNAKGTSPRSTRPPCLWLTLRQSTNLIYSAGKVDPRFRTCQRSDEVSLRLPLSASRPCDLVPKL